MKRKILKFVPFAILPLLLLTSCNLEVIPDGPVLMTAINYNEKERIIYSLDTPYPTPNGSKTITKGDYKPFWQHVQNKLNITLLEHQAAANSGEKKSVSYFRDNWLNKPYADISMGTVDAISKYSVAGNKETILDLKPYLDQTQFIEDEKGNYKVDPNHKGVLPNLALFLKVNPGLKTSIMTAKHSHSSQGALYFIPYLDGFDDTERMMMVRQDYITKLLDGKDAKGKAFTIPLSTDTSILGASGAKYHQNYERFIKDDSYTIWLPNVDDNGTIMDKDNPSYQYEKKVVTKGNIIDQQNAKIKAGKASSKELVTQFKTYIDDRYGKPGENGSLFKNYSDLFLGWKACFDTDELIALMRIMKVSTKSLYGSADNREMVTWFPTEWTNMRSADLYRWGGQVFGVRGPESRTGYLYLKGHKKEEGFNAVDRVHDCRGDKEMVELLENLQKLYKEGLLMQDFDSQQATGTTNRLFNEQLILEYKKTKEQQENKKYHGFMEYCFVNAESKLNEYTMKDTTKDKKTEDGCVFGPMIGAVTNWDTDFDEVGTDQSKWHQRDTYMQFTESWLSAKTSALCLNADLAKTPQKLANAFKLVDYIFSPEGKITYNYGPVEDGYYYPGTINPTTGDFEPEEEGKYVEYKGKKYPMFTIEATQQQKDISGVARERVGTTLPFGYEKMNGMTYQSIRKASQPGVDRVNRAIECNTFKHTCIKDPAVEYKKELGQTFKDHPERQAFYKIVPATFFLTDGQNTDIARILDKTKLGSIYTDNTNTQFNIWDDYVMGKKAASAPEFSKYYETVNGAWECPKLVTYYQDAYEIMV